MKSQKLITSRSNPEILKLREIREGKDKTLFFSEGEKIVRDLLASSLSVTHLYVVSSTESTARKLLSESKKRHVPVTVLAEPVMALASDVKTPPGLIALAKRPDTHSRGQSKNPLFLVLMGVQSPQNMGALLRTAEATGVTDVLVSMESCDPFNPKAVRGSTGSVFRLKIQTDLDDTEMTKSLRSNGIQVVAADQNGTVSYTKLDWKIPTALLVGSEGRGFKDRLLQELDATVKIPMQGKVESLNVGVAAALCLFEAARQRHELTP